MFRGDIESVAPNTQQLMSMSVYRGSNNEAKLHARAFTDSYCALVEIQNSNKSFIITNYCGRIIDF